MRKLRFTVQIISLIGLFFAAASVAEAQALRTFVSGLGDDAFPCSRTAPCKTFAGAITRTAIGGEINCLDPGGYGGVTINKSITIDCEDTQGSVLVSGGVSGIVINLNDPLDSAKNVRLRGIEIFCPSGAGNGIRIQSAGKVTVEEVVINGFGFHGISVENFSGAVNLVVKNSSIKNNAGNGINTAANGGTATVFVSGTIFAGNGVGYNQNAGTTGVLQNSTFTGSTTGIQANNANSILAVKNCRITHNGTGINAVGNPTIRIGANLIASNTNGLAGANIFTWGDNYADGNGNNGVNNGAASSQ